MRKFFSFSIQEECCIATWRERGTLFGAKLQNFSLVLFIYAEFLGFVKQQD